MIRRLLALAFVLALLTMSLVLLALDNAGGQLRCDQHAGDGRCIPPPPPIHPPDYVG